MADDCEIDTTVTVNMDEEVNTGFTLNINANDEIAPLDEVLADADRSTDANYDVEVISVDDLSTTGDGGADDDLSYYAKDITLNITDGADHTIELQDTFGEVTDRIYDVYTTDLLGDFVFLGTVEADSTQDLDAIAAAAFPTSIVTKIELNSDVETSLTVDTGVSSEIILANVDADTITITGSADVFLNIAPADDSFADGDDIITSTNTDIDGTVIGNAYDITTGTGDTVINMKNDTLTYDADYGDGIDLIDNSDYITANGVNDTLIIGAQDIGVDIFSNITGIENLEINLDEGVASDINVEVRSDDLDTLNITNFNEGDAGTSDESLEVPSTHTIDLTIDTGETVDQQALTIDANVDTSADTSVCDTLEDNTHSDILILNIDSTNTDLDINVNVAEGTAINLIAEDADAVVNVTVDVSDLADTNIDSTNVGDAEGELSINTVGALDKITLVGDANSNNTNVTIDDSWATTALTVDASAITDSAAGINNVLDGSAETDAVLTIEGTQNNDTITGGAQSDFLYGNDGDDIIVDDLGDDTIDGGAGDDVITSGAGADTIYGGTGADTITSGAGDDTVYGNEGDDTIDTGLGNDVVEGNDGDDVIVAGLGDDIIDGGADNDTITGDRGVDTMTGGTGADTFIFGDDAISNEAVADSSVGYADTITDFETGTDRIEINLGSVDTGGDDVVDLSSFATVSTTGEGDDSLDGSTVDKVIGDTFYYDGTDTEGTAQLVMDVDGDGDITTEDFAIDSTGEINAADLTIQLSTGEGDDIVRLGESIDIITTDAGDDTFVVVGQIEDADIANYSDAFDASGDTMITDYGLENVVSFAELVDENRDHTEATVGDSIDGGADNDTLHVYGTTDFTQTVDGIVSDAVTIDNIENLVIHSTVTMTTEQINTFTVVEFEAVTEHTLIILDDDGHALGFDAYDRYIVTNDSIITVALWDGDIESPTYGTNVEYTFDTSTEDGYDAFVAFVAATSDGAMVYPTSEDLPSLMITHIDDMDIDALDALVDNDADGSADLVIAGTGVIGETVTVTVSNGTDSQVFTDTVDVDGNWSVNVPSSFMTDIEADYTVTATSMSGDLETEATANFTVDTIAPELAAIEGSVTEIDLSNETVDVDIVGTLVAVDNREDSIVDHNVDYGIEGALAVDGISTVVGTYGTITLNNETGEYTYTKDLDAIENLAVGSVDSDVFTIVYQDQFGSDQLENDGVATTLTFTVTGANDAPTVETSPLETTEAEGADVYALDLLTGADDVDVDVTGTLPPEVDTLTVTDVIYEVDGIITGNSGSDVPTGLVLVDNTLTIAPTDGTFDYLAVGESQIIEIFYNVTDTQGATVAQKAVVTITGTNDAPVAVADVASATEDVEVILGNVGENDSDLDVTDTHTFTITSATIGGIAVVDTNADGVITDADIAGLSFNDDGSWTFDPRHENYDYLDSDDVPLDVVINYTIDDGQDANNTDSSTLTISVQGTDDAPIAVADTATATEYDSINTPVIVPVTGDLVANDTITDTSDIPAVYAYTDPADTVAGLTINLDGTWIFDTTDAAYDYLAAGETLDVVANYTVTDDDGLSDTSTLTITVTGTNDTPDALLSTVGLVPDQLAAEENGGVIIGSIVDADDVDILDTHTYTLGNVYDVSPGTLADGVTEFDHTADVQVVDNTIGLVGLQMAANGTWLMDADQPEYEYLAEGETITYYVEYTVTDENGASDVGILEVTITGQDDAVALANVVITGGVIETDTTADLTAAGSIAVTDVDTADVHTASVVDTTAGTAIGVLTTAIVLDGSGSTQSLDWTYTVNDADIQYLALGESKVETFDVTITDGTSSTTETVTVTITGTNDEPTITTATISLGDNETDTGITFNDTFTVGDVDVTDVVTATHVLASVSGTSDRTDAAAPSDAVLEAMVTLTPAAILDATETSAALDFTFDSGAEAFDYLAAGETLIMTFEVTVTDDSGDGATDSAMEDIVLTITGTNDAPVITGGPDVVGLSETGAVISATDTFTIGDVDTTDTVDATFALTTITGNQNTLSDADLLAMFDATPAAILDATENSDTLTWDFTSTNASDFDYLAIGETLVLEYTITATDSEGATATETVTITITGANNSPVVTDVVYAPTVETDNVQTLISDTLPAATDADVADTHTYSLDSAAVSSDGYAVPGLLATVNLDGTYTLVGNFDYLVDGATTTVSFDYIATDDSGDPATEDSLPATVSIVVTGTNDVPSAVLLVGGSSETDGLETIYSDTLGVSDLDVTDTYTFSTATAIASSNGSPTGLVVTITDANTGTFDIDGNFDYLANGETTDITFGYIVNDGFVDSAEETVTITVFGTNDAPIVSDVSLTATETDGSETIVSDNLVLTTDLDATDTHTFVLATAIASSFGAPAGLTVTITDANTGAYNVVGDFDYLAAGETTDITFGYVANDGLIDSAEQTVTITVTGTNDAPVTAIVDVDGTLLETDTAALLTVVDGGSITFTDLDTTDTATVTVADVGTPLGTVVVDGNTSPVTWTYTVNDADIQYLAAGETKTEEFDIIVDDGNGGTSTERVSVVITGNNDAPVITVGAGDENTAAILESDTVSLASTTGTLTVVDVDTADTVTASVVPGAVIAGTYVGASATNIQAAINAMMTVPAGAITADTGDTSNIDWTFNSGGETFDFLAIGETLDLTYTVEVTDGVAAAVSETVTITITGTNDLPTITVGAVTDTTIVVTATDADDNDILTLNDNTSTVLTNGVAGVYTVAARGIVTVTDIAVNDGTVDSVSVGIEVVEGTTGDDIITQVAGWDYYYGFDGNDTITGNADANIIFGGAGIDTINADELDTIDGGTEVDTVNFAAAVTTAEFVDTDLVNVENIVITNTGNATYDFSVQTEVLDITGNIGDDVILGGDGADTIDGGAGADTITGGAGADTIDVGVSGDIDTVVVGTNAADGMDTILNFDADEDLISFSNIATFTLDLNDYTSSGTLSAAITDVVTFNGGFLDEAIYFTYDLNEYVIIDDGVNAGYSDSDDALVLVTGLIGVLDAADFIA